jgi:hypothetical protein
MSSVSDKEEKFLSAPLESANEDIPYFTKIDDSGKNAQLTKQVTYDHFLSLPCFRA